MYQCLTIAATIHRQQWQAAERTNKNALISSQLEKRFWRNPVGFLDVTEERKQSPHFGASHIHSTYHDNSNLKNQIFIFLVFVFVCG